MKDILSNKAIDRGNVGGPFRRKKSRPRFGVILLPYSVRFESIFHAAARAERLGFDSIWISDHLERQGKTVLECWATISAIASLTKEIRIGSLATCNSFRNPWLLARTVATASEISAGRIDLAIGIGWDKEEHVKCGFDFPKFSERVSKLDKTLAVLGSLWDKGGSFDLLSRYQGLETTFQEPSPYSICKLWVAGRSKEILEQAAKHAYGVNILPYSGSGSRRRLSSFEEIEDLSHQIDSLSFSRDRLAKSMYCGDGGTIIGRDSIDYEAKLAKYAKPEKLEISEFKAKISNLSIVHGEVEACRRSIEQLWLLGFEELMMIFPGWQSGNYENMDLFAESFIG